MKFTTSASLASLLAVALAAPPTTPLALTARHLEKRQSMNEFTKGGCKKAIFIFARGSTEPGNVVCITEDSKYEQD